MVVSSIGLFAKVYLFFEYGCHFSYRSIDWYEGALVVSDVHLNEANASLAADKAFLFFNKKHLAIESPKIVLNGMPPLHSKSSGEWTVEMKNGAIAGEGFQDVHFTFEKTWKHHLGRLVLERQKAKLEMEAIAEGEEIWVNLNLFQFAADLLEPWIDLQGTLNGKAHLVFEGNRCKRGSARLHFYEGGYKGFVSNADGMFDWEGSVERDFFPTCLESGRVRLQLFQANIHGIKGGIEKLKGNFSFTAGVGAKWEFDGTGNAKGQEFPLGWTGRAFLHESRPSWTESKIICSDASIVLKGRHAMGGFQWAWEGGRFDAVTGTFFQSLLGIVDTRFKEFEFEKGSIEFQGKAIFGKEWEFAAQVENLDCSSRYFEVQCPFATAQLTSEKKGGFEFRGVQSKIILENGRTIFGEKWEGKGEIQKGALINSRFQGIVENIAAEIVAKGTFEGFRIEAKGEEGAIAIKGQFLNHFGGMDFEIEEGFFEGLAFRGFGSVESKGFFCLNLNHFQGSSFPLRRAVAQFNAMEGRIHSIGSGFQAVGNFTSFDWFLQAKGELENGIGFYCPFLEKRGQKFSFDVRLETPTWDLIRLYGSADQGTLTFDSGRTHVMGRPIEISSCLFDQSGLLSLKLQAPFFWKSLVMAAPIWLKTATQWTSIPCDGEARIDFSYARDGCSEFSIVGTDLSWKGDPVLFELAAREEVDGWQITKMEIEDCFCSFKVRKQKEVFFLSAGHAESKGMQADFFGTLDTSLHFAFHLPFLHLDLSQIHSFAAMVPIPLKGLKGMLEGEGIISCQANLEADFDFVAKDLQAASLDWQNIGPIHVHYASDLGIICSGIDLKVQGDNLPFLECKADLLQYTISRAVWNLHRARFRLPPHFLKLCAGWKQMDMAEEIVFTADLECPFDFSRFLGSVEKVSIPLDGHMHLIQDLVFSFGDSLLSAKLLTHHQDYPINISAAMSIGDELSGRVILEEREGVTEGERPLSVDWIYSTASGLFIREIDGLFGGVEASFHALDRGRELIGSARINFNRICMLLPPRIAEVFTDLKMGQGYELKGKLSIANGVSFRGLFSGKQIDLFGYQLRTLLAQFELDPGRIRLSDLKISDSAAMLKIDELVVCAEKDAPWTISIPHLAILELRPSLLQKPDAAAGIAGPLVVRELRLRDFKGLLEDGKTYTATGDLSFINSFRREHTVFDIPSDLLGRIVGLDLELLIPACGFVSFELQNGLFYLTALHHSFSEANRSEFFLVQEPPPIMDLNGNLRILVSMKQFVLFKLTESFQILIDGTLDDPKFHLQKKRRFLGL